MNVKNNKRHQGTLENIEKAFVSLLRDNEINKLSVTELCEVAGIDRSTFYANYEDVWALANEYAAKIKKYLEEQPHTDGEFAWIFEYIKANNIRFDMVSMDCTNVDIPISDSGTHMGFDNINRVLSVLKDIGAVDGNTVKYVNHFSHNGNPLHEHLCQRAAEYGFLVSYDGCTVEF